MGDFFTSSSSQEGDDSLLVRVVPAKSQKHPGKIKINFEDLEKNREEELKKQTEDEKKKRYDENRRSFREAKRRSMIEQVDDADSTLKEKEPVTPGKLHLTFEEQEKERQEQQRKQAEDEARRRLEEERKAFEEAKLGMVGIFPQPVDASVCIYNIEWPLFYYLDT